MKFEIMGIISVLICLAYMGLTFIVWLFSHPALLFIVGLIGIVVIGCGGCGKDGQGSKT